MPLAIYVLLVLCIALSLYPVLDELLEQREESRLKPRLQKHRHPATPADAGGAAASVKAKGMTPEKQQEPSLHRSWLHRFFFGPESE
jgi:hypothetical protein